MKSSSAAWALTTFSAKIAADAAVLSNTYEGQLFPETAERPGNEQEKKKSWMARLKAGLSKTSSNLSLLFVGARIDEDLYEELESALLATLTPGAYTAVVRSKNGTPGVALV